MRSSIILVVALCSACATVSLDPPPQPDCDAYVPDELKQDTPHAAPPVPVAPTGDVIVDSLEIVKRAINFGIAEAGQLNLANRDRRAERHIRGTCERNNREAIARAARRVRPWYRRIF